MKNLPSKWFSKLIISTIPVSISMLFLLPGCSSTTTSYRWINPTILEEHLNHNRDLRDDWAKKISDLPIELHGTLPNQPPEQTAITIRNVVSDEKGSPVKSGNILSTKQRIVLYIDGVDLPIRQDFCSLNKRSRSTPVTDQTLTLRGAVCDGEKIICYARRSESSSNYQTNNIGEQVSHLKTLFIAALYPAPTLKEARDIGAPAGW